MIGSTICSVSDPVAAGVQLGRFERENCGFMSTCTHVVEKYDIAAQSYVEITYCETNWAIAGPILLVFLFLLYKLRSMFSMPNLSSWKREKSDHHHHHSQH